MAGKEKVIRDKEMAGHLRKIGYPHGRRFSKGLTNIPPMSDVGSAAYRRRTTKAQEGVAA